MIINQLFYMVLKTSSFSIYSLAWCRHCCTFTLHLGFCPIWWDPYRQSYGLLPSQRPTLLRAACSKLRPRKLRSDRSIVTRIVHTVNACKYSTSTFNILAWAWRVHSRAPLTTSLWATRAVGEIKFDEIFVPIQSMGIERRFYPASEYYVLYGIYNYSCNLYSCLWELMYHRVSFRIFIRGG